MEKKIDGDDKLACSSTLKRFRDAALSLPAIAVGFATDGYSRPRPSTIGFGWPAFSLLQDAAAFE